MKKKVIVFVFSVVCFCLLIIAYCQLPMFGKLPEKWSLERIHNSPNWSDGHFHNKTETPIVIKNSLGTMISFLFKKEENKPLPNIKTNLKKIDRKKNVMVWFGHSSYFFQIHGKCILVDPLFSEVSSPVLFFPKAFDGSNIYKPEDMPEIDYLIITHDHWDHLDYKTIKALKGKVKHVVCPLGVGASIKLWGFTEKKVDETDWGDSVDYGENIVIHCLPSRHFSGRGLLRNKTLWASFLIHTNDFKIYIGGDSGYGEHFAEIESQFGPMDIALLDSGQHNQNWKYIHMMTDEVVKAARDLKTKVLVPAHICKLSLAYHAWNEPLKELSELMKKEKFSMLVPFIGEKIDLDKMTQIQPNWWKDLER